VASPVAFIISNGIHSLMVNEVLMSNNRHNYPECIAKKSFPQNPLPPN
jgi:hypothetical protein